MFGKPVDVFQTSSGHYAVRLQPTNKKCDPIVLLTAVEKIAIKPEKDVEKDLMKLHRQFGHASYDRLYALLQSSSPDACNKLRRSLQKACDSCSTCIQFKRPPHKPVVGFSHASRFNEVVAMDLHEIEPNLWYLHIMDLFTRQSAASIIRSKSADVIIHHFLSNWVSIYGVPLVGLYTDNGGEFMNKKFLDMAGTLNMSIRTTAAYSPWSNGTLERANAVLTEMLLKVQRDSGVSWETALAWAVMAKNSMLNVQGFSSYQLVFGTNPNLPNVFVNDLSALKPVNTSEYMSAHLRALHSARRAFVSAESSEKIQRALIKRNSPDRTKVYNWGNCVLHARRFLERSGSCDWTRFSCGVHSTRCFCCSGTLHSCTASKL